MSLSLQSSLALSQPVRSAWPFIVLLIKRVPVHMAHTHILMSRYQGPVSGFKSALRDPGAAVT